MKQLVGGSRLKKFGIFGVVLLLTLSAMAYGASAPCEAPTPRGFATEIPEHAQVLLVEVEAPWYAHSALVKKKFDQLANEYQQQPGLIRKAFTLSSEGDFGGLYIFESRSTLDQFYTPERIEEVRKKRGSPPKLSYFSILSWKDGSYEALPNSENSEKWNGEFVLIFEALPFRDDLKPSTLLEQEIEANKDIISAFILLEEKTQGVYKVILQNSPMETEQPEESKFFHVPTFVETSLQTTRH